MMNKGKMLCFFFYQILSTNSTEKCMDISVENLYLDIGA